MSEPTSFTAPDGGSSLGPINVPEAPWPGQVGTGSVTIDDVAYSFDVFSCADVGGDPNLDGEGAADVAVSAVGVIVQVDDGTTYTVLSPEVTLDGDTVEATGQADGLASSTSVTVELTATCSRF
jgi:hypothetical protein